MTRLRQPKTMNVIVKQMPEHDRLRVTRLRQPKAMDLLVNQMQKHDRP
jgi:hypothetical protein